MITLALVTLTGIIALQAKSERIQLYGQGIVVMSIIFAIAYSKNML